MKCGRLELQERKKTANKLRDAVTADNPRRYCQKRLVNPEHEEDPRWIDMFDRFHCNDSGNMSYDSQNSKHHPDEDLFLTVQNLKFQGDEYNRKRPRTSFKYKTLRDGKTHRMFVKQVVAEVEQGEDDRSSQLTCYYYDDYVKYLNTTDRSRPSSARSSLFHQRLSSKFRENKAVQVDFSKANDPIKKPTVRPEHRKTHEVEKEKTEAKVIKTSTVEDDTKIAFHNSGKRKILTISRAQSPETVQVIRVDVVCNPSGGGGAGAAGGSALSDYDDRDKQRTDSIDHLEKKIETIKFKHSHFAQKYLLTNSIKTLDENVSGGAMVTLMCKTFRLSDRSKSVNKKSANAAASVDSKSQLLK